MLYSVAYKWTKSSRAIARQLKENGHTPVRWLKVRDHLRLDAILLLKGQMLIYFVRNGVIALTARGDGAVKAPTKDPTRSAPPARSRGT